MVSAAETGRFHGELRKGLINNMKKIAFLLAAVMMVTLLCPFAVSAELQTEGVVPSYIVSSEDGTQGDKVTVKVGIRNNPGVIALECLIFFDEEVLELVSVKDTKLLNEWVEPAAEKTSPYALFWMDALTTENNESNGVIVELVFKVKKDAHAGQTEIRVEPHDACAADGMDLYDVTFEEGSAMLNITPRSTFALSSTAIVILCSVIAAVVCLALVVTVVVLQKKKKKKADAADKTVAEEKTAGENESEAE